MLSLVEDDFGRDVAKGFERDFGESGAVGHASESSCLIWLRKPKLPFSPIGLVDFEEAVERDEDRTLCVFVDPHKVVSGIVLIPAYLFFYYAIYLNY